MLLTFLGAISVAILAACVVFIARRWFGFQARWLIPASAGAAMLSFTLYNDYSWFGRISGGLPPEVVVTRSFEFSNAVQPWTLAIPAVNRFQALNRASVQRHEADANMVRAEVFLVARYNPTFVTRMVFDCAGARRADAVAPSDERGLPVDTSWVALDRDDPLLLAACAKG